MRRWSLLLLLLCVGCGRAGLDAGELAPTPEPEVDAAHPETDAAAPLDAAIDAARTDASDAATNPLDLLARVCTLAASCGATMTPPQPLEPSNCTEMIATHVPDDPVAARFFGCAGARTCSALLACLGSELLLLQIYSPNSQCQGTSIVGPAGQTYDCAPLGLTCVHEGIGERAYCAAKACGPAFTSSCNGDTLERCSDNVFLTSACPGGTCSVDHCVGSGAACDPVHTPGACSGTAATNCVGGQLDTVDCAGQPLRSACSAGQCLAPADGGPACLSGNSMCMGTDAIICTASQWRTVSCPELGFQSCVRDPNSSLVSCR
jgi:hypothetical protein